jgi:hypothetical protein
MASHSIVYLLLHPRKTSIQNYFLKNNCSIIKYNFLDTKQNFQLSPYITIDSIDSNVNKNHAKHFVTN